MSSPVFSGLRSYDVCKSMAPKDKHWYFGLTLGFQRLNHAIDPWLTFAGRQTQKGVILVQLQIKESDKLVVRPIVAFAVSFELFQPNVTCGFSDQGGSRLLIRVQVWSTETELPTHLSLHYAGFV